jgi:hypothetical protein
MQYKILTSHTASELNRMIETYIEDGWSVVGSHQVAIVHEQNRFAGTQHKDTIIEREYSISMKKGLNKVGKLLKISLSQLEDCDFESLRHIFESNNAAFIIDEPELNVIMDILSINDINDKETALDIIGKYDVEKV